MSETRIYLEDSFLVRDLLKCSKAVKEGIEQATRHEVSAALIEAVRREAPVRTGNLRDSIVPDVRVSSGGSVNVTLKPPKHNYSYKRVPYRDNVRRRNKRYKTVRELKKQNPAVRIIHLVELGTVRGVRPNPFRSRAIEQSIFKIRSIYESVIARETQ